ncbi:MAG: hypothetical protein J6K95_01635 [Rikenellaceae bacterium]|nr:hypothetical protein [Rikenellaceae bacterium]
MNRLLSLAAVALLAAGTLFRAEAQKKNDPEYRRVTVTLASGEQVEGYIHRGWYAESSLLKRENFSFKLVPSPDSKQATKYTADEVLSIDFAKTTEAHPDGIRWESHPVAAPGLSDRNRVMQRLVCCDEKNDHAALYWWKTWDVTTNKNRTVRRLITVYGIRFEGDDIVYPFSLVSTVLLKEKKPGLKEFSKAWFKGPEGKARKAEAKNSAAWMLHMYDDYLASRTAEQNL